MLIGEGMQGASQWTHALALSVMLGCSGNIADVTGGGGDDDGPGGGGPSGELGPDAQVCDQTTPISVSQTQATPDMLLVVDRSGSMGENLGGAGEKLAVMKGALASVLPQVQANIHFGLMTYPQNGSCGPGLVLTPIAPQNAAAINAQLAPIDADGSTPTHLSISAAGAYYASIPVNPDGRFVLLATDGLPNCNGAPGNPSVSQSVAAIAALANAGIKTFVIGFGDVAAADPTVLKQMAMAGGTADFYPATSPAELQQALTAISGTVVSVSCTFALQGTPQDPAKLAVTVNGAQVPRDPAHQTGWDYDAAANTISFYGASCDSLKSGGGGNVAVDYGCGGVVIE
jgi:hypothetical protein